MPACKGKRLKDSALAVTVGGMNIAQFYRLSVVKALDFIGELELTPKEQLIAERIIKRDKIPAGLPAGCRAWLPTLSRSAATLSGGESQRIRLATQMGSSLMGVLYILDEPSMPAPAG